VRYLTPRAKRLLLGLTGLLCIAEVWIAGLNYANYQIWYGGHGWFPGELAFLLHYLLFGIPAVLLLTFSVQEAAGPRILDAIERLDSLTPREVRAIVFGACSVTFFLITLARLVILKDAPISDDENAYIFMAQMFAYGKIQVPAPPEALRLFFENQFLIIKAGKMYGIYFPGHPAALAIGERLGLLHWVTTVAATLTVPLAFGIARRLFGQRTALLSLPMLLVSPYFVLSSATLLAHSTVAVLLLTFVYAALRAHEDPRALRWWLLAGVGLGWAALTRPFSAPAFAAPWLGWLAVRVWATRSPRTLVGAGASALLVVGAGLLLLDYQYALSGSPFETGYQTFSRIRNWGLVGQAVRAPAPLPSIHELGHTLARFNFWLFGWPVSLLFVAFFHRLGGGVRLFASCAGVLLVYTGISAATISSAGPAHYAELAAPLVLLSASGFVRLIELSHRPGAPAGAAVFVASFPLVATLCALATFLPVYGSSLRASADLVNAPYELVELEVPERAIVFVQSLPGTVLPPYTWAYYRRNNRPDFSDRVLFVNFLDPDRNRALMQALPDRVPYVMAMEGARLVLRRVAP
jgi:4-amino-4-deoxy-L-arabinose transferase-like glycosyltransferase